MYYIAHKEKQSLGFWGAIIGAAVSTAGSYVVQKKASADAKKLQAQGIEGQKLLIDAQAAADIAQIKAETEAAREIAGIKVSTIKETATIGLPILLALGVGIYLITRK